MNLRVSRSLTFGLAAVAAWMLLLTILFWFGVGRGYSWWPLDPVNESAGQKKLSNAQFRLGPWDGFAELTSRPLFNEDRKPTPPMPPESQGEKPVRNLDIVISGIIITPKLRMAVVKEKGKEKPMSVKEGGTLPGDWSAWSLAEIKPRSAVFKNSAGESETLELVAVANSQKPTPPPPRVTPPNPGALPAPAPGQPAGSPPILPPSGQPAAPPPQGQASVPEAASAELQQRIDARRQQIREQQQQAQHNEQPPAQP